MSNIFLTYMEDDENTIETSVETPAEVNAEVQISIDSGADEDMELQRDISSGAVEEEKEVINEEEKVEQATNLLNHVYTTLKKFGGSRILMEFLNPDGTFSSYLNNYNLPSYESFNLNNSKNDQTRVYLESISNKLTKFNRKKRQIKERKARISEQAQYNFLNVVNRFAHRASEIENYLRMYGRPSSSELNSWRNKSMVHCLDKNAYDAVLSVLSRASNPNGIIRHTANIHSKNGTARSLGFNNPNDIDIYQLKSAISNLQTMNTETMTPTMCNKIVRLINWCKNTASFCTMNNIVVQKSM